MTEANESTCIDHHLKELRKRLSTVMGVTIVKDAYGQWGQAGATHVTVRMDDGKGELVEISMIVQEVTDNYIRAIKEAEESTPQ